MVADVTDSAVFFGALTMVAWGFWIVFGNVASNAIDPEMAAFISYMTATVTTGIYLLVSDASVTISSQGVLFASAAGFAASVGVVATFIGVTVGSTAIVATIGGMYFVMAAAISVVALGEPLTTSKIAGVALAVAAIVLLNQ